MRTSDVLIAGGGPVGLTLANDLVRRGTSVTIVERLERPSTRAKAHGLQGRTVEMLDMLDVAADLVAAGQQPNPTIAFKIGGREIRLPPTALHEPYPLAVPVMQQRVEEILESALEKRGTFVDRSTTLSSFVMDDDGVTGELEKSDGTTETVRAGWLVACDGAHSVVRKQLGLVMEGETFGNEQYWLAECDISWDRSRDLWTTFISKDGLAAAIWVEPSRKWHVFVSRLGTFEDTPDLETMSQLFQVVTGMPEARLENADWVGSLVVNQRMPSSYVVGRAILAGDAAHAHTAAGGQGMNTGIQDAINLGWRLSLVASGAAPPSFVHTYEAERLPNARQLLKDTAQYHKLMFPRTRVHRGLTSLLFRSLARFPRLQRAQTQRIGMFNQHNRTSQLSRTVGGKRRSGPKAGDYLPHAACRVGGTGGSLRNVLKDPRAAVIVHLGGSDAEAEQHVRRFEEALAGLSSEVCPYFVLPSEASAVRAGLDPDDPRVILDGAGYVSDAMGFRGPEVVYVRPDGYLGLRSAGLDTEPLTSYLARIYQADLVDPKGSLAAVTTKVDVAS